MPGQIAPFVKRNGWRWLKVSVSVSLVTWLLFNVGLIPVYDTLKSIQCGALFAGFLLFFLSQIFVIHRLKILLRTQELIVGWWTITRLNFVGLFANNFLPGTVGGDAAKVVWLVTMGCDPKVSAACIVMDRFLSVLSVLIFVPVTLLVPDLLPSEVAAMVSLIAVLMLVMTIIAASIMAWKKQRCSCASNKQWGWAGSWIGSILSTVGRITGRWIQEPGTLLQAISLSCGYYLVILVSLWITGKGLGIPVGFLEMAGVITLVYFIVLVPISLNGLGVQEASLLYLLPLVGASTDQAAGMAILIRLYLLCLSLPGAVFSTMGPPERRPDFRSVHKQEVSIDVR